MGKNLAKAKLFSRTFHHLQSPNSELRAAFQSVAIKKESRMTGEGEIEDRYIFDDSSAIIVTENGWGVEGKTPWSWKALTFRDKR